MKNENKNLMSLLAFVALMIIALLEIVSIFGHFDIIQIQGGVIMSLLNTIKNICICIVVGYAAYSFIPGKQKWVAVVFWVAIAIVLVCTILNWIRV